MNRSIADRFRANGPLTQSVINPGATGYSYTVEASGEAEARNAGRLAMIADGKAPGTILYIDLDCDGTGLWEVVMTNRPLGPGQSFDPNTGTRNGMTGHKTEAYRATDEWSFGR